MNTSPDLKDKELAAQAPARVRTSLLGTRIRAIAAQGLQVREAGVVVVLILLAIGMSIIAPGFFTAGNLWAIGRNASEVGVMALGMSVVLITAQVDLSVGALYGAGGITAGLLLSQGNQAVVAIGGGLIVGVVVGLVNGVLTGYVGLNSFMVTLGTLNVVSGILEVVTNGATVSLPVSNNVNFFSGLAQQLPGGANMEFVLFLVLVAILGWLLRNSRFGFNLYAVGGNPVAAAIAGTRVPLVITGAFMLSGALAAFAGMLAMSFVGSMNPSSGTGLEFDVFAASVIGGSSLAGGRGTMFGTLLGALFLSLVRNGFILLGVSPFAQTVAIGVIIIIAIAIDKWVTFRQSL